MDANQQTPSETSLSLNDFLEKAKVLLSDENNAPQVLVDARAYEKTLAPILEKHGQQIGKACISSQPEKGLATELHSVFQETEQYYPKQVLEKTKPTTKNYTTAESLKQSFAATKEAAGAIRRMNASLITQQWVNKLKNQKLAQQTQQKINERMRSEPLEDPMHILKEETANLPSSFQTESLTAAIDAMNETATENEIAKNIAFSHDPYTVAESFKKQIEESPEIDSPMALNGVVEKALDHAHAVDKIITTAEIANTGENTPTETARFAKAVAQGATSKEAFVPLKNIFNDLIPPETTEAFVKRVFQNKADKVLKDKTFENKPITEAQEKTALSIIDLPQQKKRHSFLYDPMARFIQSNATPRVERSFNLFMEGVAFRGSLIVRDPSVLTFAVGGLQMTWDTILGWGAKKGAKAVGKEIVGVGAQKAAGAAAGKTLVKIFGATLGGPIGTVLSFFGDTILKGLWGGIKSVFSLFSGTTVAQFGGLGLARGRYQPGKKKSLPWLKDVAIAFPIAAIFFMIFPVIFPLFSPMVGIASPLFIDLVKNGAIIKGIVQEQQDRDIAQGKLDPSTKTKSIQKNEDGTVSMMQEGIDAPVGAEDEYYQSYPGPPPCDVGTDPTCAVPSCAPDPKDPSKSKCVWPVPCGYISQGQGAGTHSQANLNAIDIVIGDLWDEKACNGKNHVEITSLTDGEVYLVLDDLSEGDKNLKLGQYGNRIIIKSKDEDGKEFLVMYTHILYVAQYNGPGPMRKLQKGDPITAGQALARTDDNGGSSIEHVHVEIRNGNESIGGPDINTLLPVHVERGCDNVIACGHITIK